MQLVVEDVTLIRRTVWPFELAFARLLTRDEFSNELSAVGPLLFSFAVLDIVCPITLVLDSFYAREDSLSILFTVSPAAFVNAPVCVDHAPTSVSFVILPESLEGALVVPHYGTTSLAFTRSSITLAVVSLPFLEGDLFESQLFFGFVRFGRGKLVSHDSMGFCIVLIEVERTDATVKFFS